MKNKIFFLTLIFIAIQAKNVNPTFDVTKFRTFLNLLPGEKHSPKDVNVMVQNAQKGDKITQDILSGKPIEPTLENIELVRTYLHAQSVQQGDTFTSGLTTVKDPTGKLYEFFESYENKYDRPSSHTDSRLEKQFGIDFKGNTVDPLLNKGTALIQKLNDGTFRIKNEMYGYNSLSDKISHAWEYLTTRGDKALGRKEHVPKDVKEKFKEVLDKHNIELSNQEKIKTSLEKEGLIKIGEKDYLKILGKEKGGGIKEMRKTLQEKKPEALPEFDEFLTIQKGYDFSTLDLRKGNESVLDLSNIPTLEPQALSTPEVIDSSAAYASPEFKSPIESTRPLEFQK